MLAYVLIALAAMVGYVVASVIVMLFTPRETLEEIRWICKL